MDVGKWLRNLGLEQYESAFRENQIDGEVLPTLTVEDLKELGVAAIGHRRRLLSAIGDISRSFAAPSTVVVSPPAAKPTLAEAIAERRQLTVMFCDLVGSTALSGQLDPEDMGDVIRAFQAVVATQVARFDGLVAKLMGDGALVYFGYPHAHEDDAERAARAGLNLIDAVRVLRRDVALEVRVGIATGLVVVGELMGVGEARERGVVGETPNLAARLQALAAPGSVVIAEATRRLLGGAFELAALGPQTLKGFDAPVSAWTVVREVANVSRFEASHSEAMTPFVGREHEVTLLLDRWRESANGEGQVALLSGEPGIGKSRILAALRERIGETRQLTLRYQCSPHHANDAFYPFIGQIWQLAGLISSEPTAARLDKLDAMIARAGLEAREIAPYLASLLSVPDEGRYPALEMAPSELKERTVAALIALFEGLTKGAPALALLEDAHWIDPSSLDVFNRIIERLPRLRALLVITFRPEFAAPWVGRAHVALLSLNRFGRRQAVAMIDGLTAGKALPAEVLDEIVAKTDGVPLFVEELTKTVLESGLLREESRAYVLAAALTPLAIPSTLQDSLMARLDRLAPVKEIAQIGAAIGREFSYRLLEAVSPIAGTALQEALRQLSASELIYGRGAPPEATYIFKHALVQDTAYGSLLRSRRQRIHADIARALVERFADQVDSAPAIIAHHYTEAGLAEPAARNWLAAAELALSRSAHAEARPYSEVGLRQARHVLDESNRQSLQLSLQLVRANALVPLKGFAGAETLEALTEAKHLVDSGIGADLQRFSVLYGLWGANLFAARMAPALGLAGQFVEVAERNDDTIYRLVGYRLIGMMQMFMGQNRHALDNLRRAEQYRDPNRQKLFTYRFGTDPDLNVLFCKIWPLTFLGLHNQAARVGEQLRSEVSNHKHAATVAVCNFFVLWPELLSRDLQACERHCAELVAYCAEKKVEQWRLLTAICHALACAMLQPTAESIVTVRAAIGAKSRTGIRMSDSVFIAMLAEALLTTGDVMGAEETLREAFAFVEESGERFWLAELHRLDGQIALKQQQPDKARAANCFLQAMEIARSQGALMLQLRASTDLARLWGEMGSGGDPRALLEPILADTEGGETTSDVGNARALLAEIG